MSHIQVYKNFYQSANDLRHEFENHFLNPRSTTSKRFVWDKWFIKNQYNVMRTPASYYFSENKIQKFQDHLIQWGRENLGCHSISPPWLSYYTEGCFQNMHSDVPHGPWAFVYSLTPKKKVFEGGETFILKPTTLNYWTYFNDETDREYKSFVDTIPSQFNQLIVFDPRYPHGVTEVKGTQDPLEARLVIHGWFVEPRPYVVGGLSTAQVQKSLNPCFELLNKELISWPELHGTVSIRLTVSPRGQIKMAELISTTLKTLVVDEKMDRLIHKELIKFFSMTQFPVAKTSSKITLPLLFK